MASWLDEIIGVIACPVLVACWVIRLRLSNDQEDGVKSFVPPSLFAKPDGSSQQYLRRKLPNKDSWNLCSGPGIFVQVERISRGHYRTSM